MGGDLAVVPAPRLTTAELLLEWDRRRPRSQQREFGMSGLGGCERKAGYTFAGAEPTNDKPSIQAVLGTLIHEGASSVYVELQAAGLIPAEDLVEFEVRFAGILGHLDRFEVATGDLVDIKTVTSYVLKKIKAEGPGHERLWQANMYAAALIALGYQVKRIILDFIVRDTGEEHRYIDVPDPQHVRDALAWVRRVKATDVDWLPREYAPDSVWCQGCPFLQTCWGEDVTTERRRDLRQVLYREDPDAPRWAEQLWQARQDKKDAVVRETEAKGALDALRPNDDGKATVDVGWRLPLRWSVKTTERLDGEQVRADYIAAGATAPTKTSTSVELGFGPAIPAAAPAAEDAA